MYCSKYGVLYIEDKCEIEKTIWNENKKNNSHCHFSCSTPSWQHPQSCPLPLQRQRFHLEREFRPTVSTLSNFCKQRFRHF